MHSLLFHEKIVHYLRAQIKSDWQNWKSLIFCTHLLSFGDHSSHRIGWKLIDNMTIHYPDVPLFSCWLNVKHGVQFYTESELYSAQRALNSVYSALATPILLQTSWLWQRQCNSPRRCHQLQHVQQTDADSWPVWPANTEARESDKIPFRVRIHTEHSKRVLWGSMFRSINKVSIYLSIKLRQ